MKFYFHVNDRLRSGHISHFSQSSIRGSLPGITDGWSLGKPYPQIAVKISFNVLDPL